MTRLRPALALPLLLVVAACGSRDKAAANNAVAPAGFVPPPMQKAKPLPGQEQRPPLGDYVGKYPTDAVSGIAFFDRTEVAQALVDAVGDEALRHRIVARDSVTVPIFRLPDGRIAAHGCTAHDCGDQNWTFIIQPDGDRGEACWHDADKARDASFWYAGSTAMRRPGDCPQG